jgi:hypothetical protein
VTIRFVSKGGVDSQAMMQGFPDWLRKYPCSISGSNEKWEIKFGNYDRPLDDLAACFPNLVFDKVDTAQRTINASEKE